MVDFSGIWVPVVTPFDAQGALDLAALSSLVGHLARQGVAGFVACGSTGEAAMLSVDEQDAVLTTVLAASQGLPVLMGLSGVNAQAVAARCRALAAAFADQTAAVSTPGHTRAQTSARVPAGLLLTAPAYVKPSQAGIAAYFHAVADASPLPVVAYDVPSRTGVRIQATTLLALADHPRIVAVKDCSGDRSAAEAVLADGRLALLGGNDDELFDQLARGARGAIVASAHVATAQFVALHQALSRGHLADARQLWRGLWPLTQALFAEPNPSPVKAVLAQQTGMCNQLRAPLLPASAAVLNQALHCLAHLSALPPGGAGGAGPAAPGPAPAR